jgi:hypothetical protein
MSGRDSQPDKTEGVDKSGDPRFIEFYNVDPSVVKERPRRLLREYSKIPNDEIENWIEQIVGVPTTIVMEQD